MAHSSSSPWMRFSVFWLIALASATAPAQVPSPAVPRSPASFPAPRMTPQGAGAPVVGQPGDQLPPRPVRQTSGFSRPAVSQDSGRLTSREPLREGPRLPLSSPSTNFSSRRQAQAPRRRRVVVNGYSVRHSPRARRRDAAIYHQRLVSVSPHVSSFTVPTATYAWSKSKPS